MISKRSINPGLLLLVIVAIQTATADNSIITHKYTADPNAMVWNDRVYVFCSRDDNNGEGYDIIDYTLISSDDMVNWTDHGEVFRVPRDASWANRAYAPGAAHKNGKFYLYFPDGGSSIGVAVADKIEGPYKDAIGRALVNKSMPNCNVEWLFDPAAFIDDDGQAYLYFGGGGSTPGTNLRVIKLGDNMISTDGTAVTISAPRSFEAAFMHKRNGIYYFSYSTDFNGSSARIDYMTSNNPMTGFQYKGIILDNPSVNGKNINMGNNNHASVVEFKDKWYVFYHERRVSNQVYKRSVSVDLADYNADGTMKKTVCTDNGPPQIKYLDPYDIVEAETINRQSGIKTDVCSEGGIMVTSISDGDYIRVKGVDFGDGAERFEVRAASGSSGGRIELRLGSQTGTLVGTCEISNTGGWTTWKTFECDVSDCSGVKDLYLVFKGSGEPFRLNWYRFIGASSGYRLSIQTTGKGTVNRSPNKSNFPEGTQVTLTAVPADGWVFDGWSGDGVSGSQNPLTITMNSDRTVTAVFKRNTVDGNLVLNGDFSSGTDNWTLNTWSGSGTGSVTNGEYRINISSVADNSHDIQLVQAGLFLESGMTYQVVFEAYAASSRSLEVNVEMDESPWTSYLPERKTFNLTTAKQEYSFVFTMENPTDANGRIGFNAGLETPAVFIDNVKIKEFSVATVSFPEVVQSSGMKVNCRNSVLNLEFTLPENGPVSLHLYDLKGKMVKSIAVQKRSGTVYSNSFDLSGISEGSYVLKIRSQGKTIGSSRVLLVK
jgi:arabinoxylan arabinofuranohydrolase